jgi:hypothetical protein
VLLVVGGLVAVLAWVDELLHAAATSEAHSVAPTANRRLIGSDRKDTIPPLTPKNVTARWAWPMLSKRLQKTSRT